MSSVVEHGEHSENSNSHDDFSLSRVPAKSKQKMWQVIVVRLGAFACVSQLMLGASLGYGMEFSSAVVAVLLGSVILQVVGFAIGLIAAREGLSISLLSKWSGFGSYGSALIGLAISIALVGWFGVQNSVFAQGLYQATHLLSLPIWSLITGASIVLIVIYGFKMLSYTANIALPLFLLAVFYAAAKMLEGYDLNVLVTGPAPGPTLSLSVATTMVAGGFIIGAVITPDISRFLSNGKEVFWMVLISTFVGELSMCLLAVIMAHAVGSNDIMTIMLSLSGWLGAAIVIFSTIKINDFNLYSGSLGITAAANVFLKKKINRAHTTIVIGCIGTILSAVGLMNHFIDFLIFLGISIPPVAGIIVTDYFILKRERKVLDESREAGELPKTCEILNPVTLIAWACAFVVGYYVQVGIPSINSMIAAAIVYFIGMKLFAAVQQKPVAEFARTERVID